MGASGHSIANANKKLRMRKIAAHKAIEHDAPASKVLHSKIRVNSPLKKSVESIKAPMYDSKEWVALVAAGKKGEDLIAEQIRNAHDARADLIVDGRPIEVKFYSRNGREVTTAERVAAAQARRVADQKRGLETPDWIVRLSDADL